MPASLAKFCLDNTPSGHVIKFCSPLHIHKLIILDSNYVQSLRQFP